MHANADDKPVDTGRRTRSAKDASYAPIESYAVIGDLRTAALVGLDGSIDFLCVPAFDSPTVFAALLDAKRGGSFSITPKLDNARRKQLYLPDTCVLLSRFLSAGGVSEISDFMPITVSPRPTRVVRRVKTVQGSVEYLVRCAPRFAYATAKHRIERSESGVTFVPEGAGNPVLHLSASVPLEVHDGDAVASFRLNAGDTASFVLEHVPADARPLGHDKDDIVDAFKRTTNFWRRWIGHATYNGRWRDEVNRSALTLKLLQYRPSGALVAAPTFGLPEVIGGERNWDYRYTWIRDASYTLYAMIRLGLADEAHAFIDWLIQRVGESLDPAALMTLYCVDRGEPPKEKILSHFEGYRGSRPVRIGNAAHAQLQLDVYGELLDAIYLYDKIHGPVSYDLWRHVAAIVDWVCGNWQQPDEGIWEPRSARRDHLYSRVLCWVAVDRGIRLSEKRSLPAPVDRWRVIRDEIYTDVHEHFWDPKLHAFVGALGSNALDAACLIMPLVRFIGPTDPRWLSTLRAVERRLVSDSLVYRYEYRDQETDGLAGVEGTFSICSFWYVECLSRAGDLQQARFLLEKLFGYANHVGLYAEEIGPSGEHLGNYPQALTHIALISAAFDVDRRLTAAGWRA